jgi:ubiquinone/menaquinone biosynthesis C-methylase UbiE
MAHVCPWWLTYTFDNPLRRLLHDRRRILRPLVRDGMVVADVGCGMGYFTAALAELVGPTGLVFAIDVQQQQLDRAMQRCEKAGLRSRVEPVLADAGALSLPRPLDFALSFWMFHEVDRPEPFVARLAAALRPGASWLVTEPRYHVSAERFAEEVALVERAGFASTAYPVRWSLARLLTKGGDGPSARRR